MGCLCSPLSCSLNKLCHSIECRAHFSRTPLRLAQEVQGKRKRTKCGGNPTKKGSALEFLYTLQEL